MRLSAELFRLWRRDPVAFCNDVFTQKPYPRQEAALNLYAEHDSLALACCRGWGKSRFLAFVGLHWISTAFDSLTFTTAPRWGQVTHGTWSNIRYLWQNSKLPRIFPSWEVMTNGIRTPSPLWRAVGVAAARPEDTEGRHAGSGGALVLLDEAKGIADPFYDSVQNILGRKDIPTKKVAGGTPGIPRGWYYRAFASDRALWGATVRGSAMDVPELRDHAIREAQRLGEDSPFWRQQQNAEFAMAEGNVVIPLNYVEAAVDREMVVEPNWRRVASLDPAGTGDDESVLTLTHGPIVRKQLAWQGWDETRTAKYTWDQALSHQSDYLIVDEPGIGLAICYLLETMAKDHNARTGDRIQVIRYKPGKRARDRERFKNRKSEDIFALADRFREGDISIPNHPTLIGQLVSYTWASTTGSQTEVIDPPDSPDYADSMQMAFALDSAAHHVRGINHPGIN